jgi:glycosyltransferase involved in cell wall biosynthesis
MKVTIVTPVFNEEKRVTQFLKELLKEKYEVVVVDDGSTDSTSAKLNNFKDLKKIVVIAHKINLGKGAALKTGCDYAFSHGAEAVILMDSDGQHSVSELSNFKDKLISKKYDVVLGSRNLSLGVPLVRFLGNKIASLIVNFLYQIYISDLISGFRAVTKKAYKKVKWESTGYSVETEIIVRMKKANLTYCEIPITTIYYDGYKGVSILDSFGVFINLFYWKISIK